MRNNALALCAALVVAAPASAQINEENFFYIPKAEDTRFQKISRADNETQWPFTVDEGLLACIYAAGKPLVVFLVEDGLEADGETVKYRSVTVSLDPFESVFGNMAENDLIADDGGNVERRMELFLPLHDVGARLCKQPKGVFLGPGEL